MRHVYSRLVSVVILGGLIAVSGSLGAAERADPTMSREGTAVSVDNAGYDGAELDPGAFGLVVQQSGPAPTPTPTPNPPPPPPSPCEVAQAVLSQAKAQVDAARAAYTANPTIATRNAVTAANVAYANRYTEYMNACQTTPP